MESRRKQRWDGYGRSRNKKPPRGTWQPKVPNWEKQFCKTVGSMDWETLLNMKKFIHLYDDVIKWNDFAGEEAFLNAKKRFWAEINGFSCDLPLPDPDLYIDKINWDSQTDQNLLFELDHELTTDSNFNSNKDHGPVVIFGDSLVSSQEFSDTGWGEYCNGESSKVQADRGVMWEQQNWGSSFNYHQDAKWL